MPPPTARLGAAPWSGRRLLLGRLLRGLERVQHLLLDVRGGLGEGHDVLAAVPLDLRETVLAGGRHGAERERAMTVGADVHRQRERCVNDRSFHAGNCSRYLMACPMRSQSPPSVSLLTM